MFEYRIVRGSDEHVQKVLNQWRHEYILKLMFVGMRGGELVVLLKRKPKEEKEGE